MLCLLTKLMIIQLPGK